MIALIRYGTEFGERNPVLATLIGALLDVGLGLALYVSMANAIK